MSNYTKATNFAAKDALPTGNSGKIIKGTEIDTEFNAIASAISSKTDTNSPTFTGTPLAPTASSGTNNTQIATTAFVTTAIAAATAALVPAGMIMIWSGSVGTIPAGWVLCNGSNSTPDLRDKFVIGAGNSYAVGGAGGSKDAVVVSHTHTATVTDPGHLHTVDAARNSGAGFISGGGNAFDYNLRPSNTGSAVTGISVGISTTGSSGTNANLPPYYALCYIMKT